MVCLGVTYEQLSAPLGALILRGVRQAMKIIKRNGSEVTFDISKIENAIRAANAEVPQSERLTEREVKFASLNVTDECMEAGHTVTVEEVQDLVEDQLMALDHFEVALLIWE